MSNLNVLLVDDEPEVSLYMKRMLASKAPNLSITTVSSGNECLERLSEQEVDCILSDYQMPGMDGMELLGEVRRKGENTPFIFITGQGNEEVAREAFKFGAYDYFTKDVGFAHFARIINSIELAVAQSTAARQRDAAESSAYSHSRKLDTLAQAVRTVNAVLDIPEVMRRLVASAMKLVDGTSGAAGLFINGQMVFTEYNMNGALMPIDFKFGPNYGVPGHVMATMAPYVSADATKDPAVIPEIQAELGFITLIDVPIVSRSGGLLGCFEIHDKDGGARFTDDDVSLLESLAAGAAVAIDNAMLLESVSMAGFEWEETFDAMDDLVTVHDLDFTVTKVNKAACDVVGLDREEVIGRKYFDIFPLSGERYDSPLWTQSAADSKNTMMRHEVRIDDRYYDACSYPIRAGEDVVGYVNVAKDITDRKLDQESALKSKDALAGILDSLDLGIIVVGYDRRIRQVNRAALDMMGRESRDEVVGHRCHEFICPAEEGKCPVLDLGQNVDLSERSLLDCDGRKKSVIKSVSPIRIAGEEVLLETCFEPGRRIKRKDEAA
jgi:PAS domain S-box-containing protein